MVSDMVPMPPRERLVWVLALVAGAYFCFNVPGIIVQRDDDAAFTAPMAEIRRGIDQFYVSDVPDETLQLAAITSMTRTLDAFSGYIPPSQTEAFTESVEGRFVGIGVTLAPQPTDGPTLPPLVVAAPIEGGPAQAAGVRAGDEILEVDGENVVGLPLAEIQGRILGEANTVVELLLRHADDVEERLAITRGNVQIPQVVGLGRDAEGRWVHWLDEPMKIGYVRLNQFTPGTASGLADVTNALAENDLAGLVLDLRGNPGGFLEEAALVLNLFLDRGLVLFSVQRKDSGMRPTHAAVDPPFGDVPVVVLIDGGSASASEVVAGALKDHDRATIVGRRSFGKGSVQQTLNLRSDGGGLLKLTIARYYRPSGEPVRSVGEGEAWGIEPDVIVELPTTRPDGEPIGPATRPMDDPDLRKAVELFRERIEPAAGE